MLSSISRVGRGLLCGALLCAPTAVLASPNTRLFVEVVQPRPGEAHAPNASAYFALEPVVVHEETGQIWRLPPCGTWCTFTTLPPGSYRVLVESSDGQHRYVLTGIAVRDRRPVSVRIAWRPGHHEVKARAYLTPWRAPDRPGTRVSILEPQEHPGPLSMRAGIPIP